MMHRIIRNVLWIQVNRNKHIYYVGQDAVATVKKKNTFSMSPLLESKSVQQAHKKYKHGRKKQIHGEESSSEDNDQDSDDDTDSLYQFGKSKIIKKNIGSLRLDAVLKTGLGVGRNKIDEAFYQGNIRINGAKVFKKSTTVKVGDEIDLIRGNDIANPDLLNISRVYVLKAEPQEDCIQMEIARDMSLTIENYQQPWKI